MLVFKFVYYLTMDGAALPFGMILGSENHLYFLDSPIVAVRKKNSSSSLFDKKFEAA